MAHAHLTMKTTTAAVRPVILSATVVLAIMDQHVIKPRPTAIASTAMACVCPTSTAAPVLVTLVLLDRNARSIPTPLIRAAHHLAVQAPAPGPRAGSLAIARRSTAVLAAHVHAKTVGCAARMDRVIAPMRVSVRPVSRVACAM